MNRQKVLTLMHRDLVPPEKATDEELEKAEWKTEYYVVDNLKKSGHEVLTLGVIEDLGKIDRAVDEFKPNIAFNLLEEFQRQSIYDQNIVSYLELKNLKYTGCNPRGLLLARDKALSKKIMKYHRIPCPRFQVFPLSRKTKKKKEMIYPLIVKSLIEEGSLGISQSSIVTNDAKLNERVAFIHESLGTDAIVEQFIEGRELYVGVMGNRRLSVFPPWELVFGEPSEGMKTIATSRVKHSVEYREKYQITTREAESLEPQLLEQIKKVCKRTAKALSLDGYSRMDLRLDPEGRPYVIEANPNPDIADYEDFAMSAHYFGYEYPELLDQIIHLGLTRPQRKA